MKLRFLLLSLAVICMGVQFVSAQTTTTVTPTSNTRQIRALEVEIGGGIVTPTQKLNFDKNNLGWTAEAELRYNFKKLPLDLGIHVDGALFSRSGEQLNTTDDLKNIAKAKFTSLTTLAVVDINFWRAKNFSLFVGCGVGYGMLINDMRDIDNIKDIDRMGCFCAMPRVGFELFRHVRATLYYKYLKTEQNHFGASIGIVFGGGKKR